MVNLEAALLKTPSITTYKTGLTNWDKNGGILTNSDEDSISNALIKVSKWDKQIRIQNGEKIFNFVRLNYNLEKISNTWIEKYSEIKSEFQK